MLERDLIQALVEKATPQPGVTVGLGDDLAVLERPGGPALLVGVDPVIAGVHFDPQRDPPELVGRKALCRNLSDVAAMAARPVACLAALTIDRRKTGSGEQALAMMQGLQDAAGLFRCPLVGGDTASADGPTTLSVTVVAEAADHPPITRAGAQPGDLLCVTGPLGGALLPGPQGEPPHHLAFTPRVDTAVALANAFGDGLHAMMDLSDGLAMDAPRLAQASGVDLEFDLDALPVRPVAQQAHPAPEARWRAALGDGEDYELLVALAPGAPPEAALPPDLTLTAIGRAVALTSPPRRVAWLMPDGRPFDTTGLGWEHATP